jgi:hypothetical protein
VDQITAPLPVPPELVKAVPDLVHAILDPLIGPSAPKPREELPDVVKHLIPGKTLRAEGADEAGENYASEDSSLEPSTAQAEASTPTANVAPNPPTGCLPPPGSGPVRRQEYGARNGESSAPTDQADSSAAPAPSGSGGDVGCTG